MGWDMGREGGGGRWKEERRERNWGFRLRASPLPPPPPPPLSSHGAAGGEGGRRERERRELLLTLPRQNVPNEKKGFFFSLSFFAQEVQGRGL